jgi:hypothetical protein
MRDNRCPDRERVRIDIKKSTLDDASRNAAENGESLSAYVERLIESATGAAITTR